MVRSGSGGGAKTRTTAKTIVAVEHAELSNDPFPHWLLNEIIPPAVYNQIVSLPIAPADIDSAAGKRSSYNDSRVFINPELRKQHSVMDTVARTFQDPKVVSAIEKKLGINLEGSSLRIEYCQDKDGFQLEPHKDIPEKLMTMQIYLADDPKLGTDLYDKDQQFYSSVMAKKGTGMVFLPKTENSWHGFEKRPIDGIRRSLIVNYVTPEFRAKHELAFPDCPIVNSLAAGLGAAVEA